MTKTAPSSDIEMADGEAICSTATIAALLLRSIPPPAIQQRGPVRALRHRPHGHVIDQERRRYALLTEKVHPPPPGRVACETSRTEARMSIEPQTDKEMPKGVRKSITIPGLLAGSKLEALQFDLNAQLRANCSANGKAIS